jgi:hypothetical protein
MASINAVKKRKAQFDIQFNWIFVIIAGAIILLFFLSIVYKQIGKSDVQVSRKVVDQLEAIFTGSEVATSTAQPVDMPDIQINFVCDSLDTSRFDIEGTGIGKDILTTAFFAPDTIKGRRMTTWALDWSIPFKITNFLYITSPEARYYFIGTDKYNLLRDLPPANMMTREEHSSSPNEIKDKNNYKVKFVYFDTDPFYNAAKFDLNNDDKDISAIKISENTIKFYRFKNGFNLQGEIGYSTKTELYAAIFAEDLVSYKCNMKKVFRRLEYVSQVYGGRAAMLGVNNPLCQYSEAIEDFDYLKNTAKNCYLRIETCDFAGIESKIGSLETKNSQLQFSSCPLIY